MDKRYGKVKWGKGQPRVRAKNFDAPMAWNKNPWVCDECGHAGKDQFEECNCSAVGAGCANRHRRRVFSLSLGDWLDDEVPIEWLADMLDVIRLCPNLDFLLVTKRPENWRSRIDLVKTSNSLFEEWLIEWLYSGGETLDGEMFYPPKNVWIGVSVENQDQAEKRIPELLKIPAEVRFLSCEPLLGPVDIFDTMTGDLLYESGNEYDPGSIDWVICGGESGHNSRPMHHTWSRSLRDQCRAAHDGVPFFMKQMGGNRKPFPEIPDDLMIREFPQVHKPERVLDSSAGHGR